MRRLLVLLAIFGLNLPLAANAAEGVQRAIADAEARGLRGVSSKRLKALLTDPSLSARGTHKGVQYSRSWIDSQPAASGGDDWQCLSEALYFEARGETVKGQFAVAEVIMNRVKSARFPTTVCGVINQGTGKKYQCQFTYTCDGHAETIREPKAFERVAKVAKLTLDGGMPELTSGATHYHTTAVSPAWSRTYRRTARIGVHLFYRHNFRTASN
ncbi:MAG: cell wall hydrolase [Rhodobacteraceae bacterium]|nr:cell wall hydrolase [Paracoccaceae bacterium]